MFHIPSKMECRLLFNYRQNEIYDTLPPRYIFTQENRRNTKQGQILALKCQEQKKYQFLLQRRQIKDTKQNLLGNDLPIRDFACITKTRGLGRLFICTLGHKCEETINELVQFWN